MKEQKTSPVELIYTDLNKNKYFGFTDTKLLPPKRAMAAMVFTRFADLRLTWPRLTVILNEMERLFNQGEFMKAGALIEEVRLSESLWAEPETLRDLATVFVMVEGENPLEFDRLENEKKKQLWAKDSEAEAFFLSLAYRHTQSFSENSHLDLKEYFNEVAALLKRTSRWRGSTSPGK